MTGHLTKVPALFSKSVLEEYPQWEAAHLVRTTPITRAIKCPDEGKHWISEMDGNVWEARDGCRRWSEIE